jgi:hypothetical protein
MPGIPGLLFAVSHAAGQTAGWCGKPPHTVGVTHDPDSTSWIGGVSTSQQRQRQGRIVAVRSEVFIRC